MLSCLIAVQACRQVAAFRAHSSVEGEGEDFAEAAQLHGTAVTGAGDSKAVGNSTGALWPFEDIYYYLNEDAKLKDKGGLTSLAVACWHSKPPEVLQHKIEKHGVGQVNTVDKMWMTPFAWASLRWTRHVEKVNEAFDPELAANDRANMLLLLGQGAKLLIGSLPKKPLWSDEVPVWTAGQSSFKGQYDPHALPPEESARDMARMYRSGGHLLIQAAGLGDVELIRAALGAVEDVGEDMPKILSSRGKHQRTPLHTAMVLRPARAREVAETLLAAAPAAATVGRYRDLDGRTCLHLLLLERMGADWAKLLLSRVRSPLGAVQDDSDRGGRTALHYAVAGDFAELDIATLLLDHGFPVDATSRDGESALDDAVASNNGPAIQLLLARGASLARYKERHRGSVSKKKVTPIYDSWGKADERVEWMPVARDASALILAELRRRVQEERARLEASRPSTTMTTPPENSGWSFW